MADTYRPVVADTAISFEFEPPDAAEMERRRAAALAFAPWLVFDDGGVLGYAYASRHRERAAYQWCVDVSVYVAQRHQRRGIGRGLYTSLLALLRFGLHRGDELHRHRPIEQRVVGQVDVPHGSLADQAHQLVAVELLDGDRPARLFLRWRRGDHLRNNP